MELILKDVQKKFTVSDSVFCCPFNEALIHQVVTSYASGGRQGTQSQKSRAEVAGSNKKPWRQKGTGRARAGSIRSPIWRSGGVTFAARPRDYRKKVNKKMYRNALKSILSELIRQDRLVIVENFSINAPKTKLLYLKLGEMLLKHVLIITNKCEKNLLLSARNLHTVSICNVTNVNPINLISSNKVLMTIDAAQKIEEMLV